MNTLFESKVRSCLLVATLAVASLMSNARAQSPGNQATVNVPFSFQVGAHHFAPGVYSIRVENEHVVTIRSGSDSAEMMTTWETSRKPAATPKVVFRKYGEQYFLRELWMNPDVTYRSCVETRTEKQAAKQLSAASHVEPGNAEIALR
jgi:hypothetical protein